MRKENEPADERSAKPANISYRIVSYRIVSYRIEKVSYRIMSYRIEYTVLTDRSSER